MKKDRIDFNSLIIDIKNPRYKTYQENEKAAIIEMMRIGSSKLLNLMESIVEDGLSPIENLAIYSATEYPGKYVVAEGNRRFCAIKMLYNPDLAKEGRYNAKQITQIIELSHKFLANPINKIECTIFDNYEAAALWMRIKHSGQLEGIGTVTWGAEEKIRFDERVSGKSFTTIIKEYFIEKGVISLEDADKIAITNLVRFVADKKIAEFLGFDINEKKLIFYDEYTGLFDVIVGYIVKQLALKQLNVKTIYDQKDRFIYLYNVVFPAIQSIESKTDLEFINSHFKINLGKINQLFNLSLVLPITEIVDKDFGQDTLFSDGIEPNNSDNIKLVDYVPEIVPGTTTEEKNNNAELQKVDLQIEQEEQIDSNATCEDDEVINETIEEEILERVVKSFTGLFKSLKEIINNCKIEDELKRIIWIDANNALFSFDNKAWKASAVMLGAILEGVMLGTLIREDTIKYVINNHSQFTSIHKLGLLNPAVINHREKILKDIEFEQLRIFIQEILPETEKFNIRNIQEIRNIIHPANALRAGNYKRINQEKVISLLANCKIIINEIVNWDPPVAP